MTVFEALLVVLAWFLLVPLIVLAAAATYACRVELRQLRQRRHARRDREACQRLLGYRWNDPDTCIQDFTEGPDPVDWRPTRDDVEWLAGCGVWEMGPR